MARKIIITDIDGVLLDIYNHTSNYLINTHGWNIKPFDGKTHSPEWLDMPKSKVANLYEILSREQEFSKIPAFPEAKDFIKKVNEKGYLIVGLSAWPNNPISYNNRVDNLLKEFGQVFYEIRCVGIYGSKEEHLKHLPKAVWIEDNTKWANLGADLGHTTYLVNRGYNLQEETKVKRINSLRELYPVLNIA